MGAGRHEEHAHRGKEDQGVIFPQVLAEFLQIVGRKEDGERGAQNDNEVEVKREVVEVYHAGEVNAQLAPEAVSLPGGHGQGQKRQDGEDALAAPGSL